MFSTPETPWGGSSYVGPSFYGILLLVEIHSAAALLTPSYFLFLSSFLGAPLITSIVHVEDPTENPGGRNVLRLADIGENTAAPISEHADASAIFGSLPRKIYARAHRE